MSKLLLSATLFLFCFTSMVSAAPVKGLYVAVGDSITAGAIAETWSPKSSSSRNSLRSPSSKFSTEPLYPLVESRYGNSWATGQNISSYFKKLKNQGRFQIPQIEWIPYNVALTNRTFTSLPQQLEALKKKVIEVMPAHLQVTLFLGANDLCHYGGPMGSFATQPLEVELRKFIEGLDQILPSIKKDLVLVQMLRIPDLNDERFLNAKAVLAVTCREVRSLLGSCPYLTRWNSITDKAYAQLEVDKFNDMIRVSERIPTQSVRTHVADGIKDQTFDPGDLATDCFHPGKSGQQKIADQIWKTRGF